MSKKNRNRKVRERMFNRIAKLITESYYLPPFPLDFLVKGIKVENEEQYEWKIMENEKDNNRNK